MNLFLSPHCDDESLFGAYTIMREHPQVVVVFDGQDKTRRAETIAAMTILGASVRFLGLPDAPVPPDAARAALAALDADRAWAPAVETGGNAHHNLVGQLADELWPGRVTHYLTYTARLAQV